MAAPKKTIAPPIDRPLSKAYLREFKGWSTAFPPGLSDPSSLQVMHNCTIDSDMGLRIRPGLRAVMNPAHVAAMPGPIIGSFEHFWYAGGVKALLFAIRTATQVEFRVARWNAAQRWFDVETTTARFGAVITLSHDTSYVKWVQINNQVFALPESTNPLDTWVLFDVAGTTGTRVRQPRNLDVPEWTAAHQPIVVVPSNPLMSSHAANATPQTATTTTLVNSDATKNTYFFGFFYTFANDIGESAPSRVGTIKVQRPWYGWTIAASGLTEDSPDQLLITIPADAWTRAHARGAKEVRVYALAWTSDEAYPVQGQLIATKPITANGSTAANTGENFVSMHPLTRWLDALSAVPSGDDFFREIQNSSFPHAAGNGLVAADRIFLVYNRAEAAEGARIRWSGNQQGEYTNFSSAVGGGFKTLTSGNLYHPVAVKLWQNPQSVDTVTVLCEGLDGEGTAYYLTPNSTVNTQSQALSVMAVEETTATPGTVSPFGCEVLNNALYHPLDNNIMKSTANNYNISHAMMADTIQNIWRAIPLSEKKKIVCSQLDQKLYYLVRAPSELAWSEDTTSNGNQVWVCDTALKGTWSCWDVPGTSLRKLEIEGQLFMALTSGTGIYVFDPEQDFDHLLGDMEWDEVGIPWEIRTNTQGANRGHDAWAYLQQLEVVFGNFTGECEYGLHGWDVYGKEITASKTYRSPEQRSHEPLQRYDLADQLRVERTMKEWTFFWKSTAKPKRRTYGSISSVQYRYTPATVNVGYAYGSVETFEYGSPTPEVYNGIPVPFVDTHLP